MKDSRTRILVVDDDTSVLEVFATMLRLEGYDVWQASTGREGLALTRRRQPHLVLLDVMLPDISGLEVCRQIKSDPALPDVFVALLSGSAISGAHKMHGAATGADDYIVKPVGREELLARTRTLIRLRETTVALRSSEQHYRQLLEILPDGVCLMSPYGQLLAINPQGVAMLGFGQQEELLGRSLFDFLPPQEHDRAQGDLEAVLASGTLRGIEYSFLRRTGQLVPVELSLTVLKKDDGLAAELVAVVRDISRRKRAEDQIRILADAVQSAQELISITDPEGRLTFVNQAFLRAYGYQMADVLGRTTDFLRSEKNSPELLEEIREQTLKGGWRGELLNRRRDESEFPISLSTSQIKNSTGQLIGLIGVARDITDRVRVDRQRAAFTQLGHRLSAVTTVLQAANIILEIASDLFGWDSGYFHLYSESDDKLVPVLNIETIRGRKTIVTSGFQDQPTSLHRQVMSEGARLITGSGEDSPTADTSRFLASMMYVPIQAGSTVVGILSVKSQLSTAYSAEDLKLLQLLANYCGDALQRIRAVEALERSRRLQRAILDNIPDPAWLKDALGRFEACNEALAKLIGLGTAEIVGKTVFDLNLPDAERQHREDVEVMRVGKPGRFEMRRTDAGGRVRWFESSKSPLLGDTGEIAGTVGIARDVTDRKLAEEELWRLPRRIIEAQEAERLRVSRELHDGVNQLIASAQLRLRRVEAITPDFRPAAREILARCSDLLVQALEENRRIAHNLRPGELDQLGLTTACRQLCKQFHARTNVAVRCHITRLGRSLAPATELNLFRIVQEAFNNVEKHARATTVRLSISMRDDLLVLVIEDNGSGFNPKRVRNRGQRKGGVGLTNIRERVAAIGGTYEIRSAPSQGTTIVVHVPCHKADGREQPELPLDSQVPPVSTQQTA